MLRSTFLPATQNSFHKLFKYCLGACLFGFGLSAQANLIYVPSTYDAEKSYPMYVVLHGCLQSSEDMASISRFNQLAEENEFLVLYPEQRASANISRCWNWFERRHQGRGGEPQAVVNLIDQIADEYSVNLEKVYAVGFSAGGGLANILAFCYPERFAGVAIHSGVSYRAASSMLGAFSVMKNAGLAPADGEVIREGFECSGRQSQTPLSFFIVHGDRDNVLDPRYLTKQFGHLLLFNDLLDDGEANGSFELEEADVQEHRTERGYNYFSHIARSSKTYNGRKVVVGALRVQQLGHAWSGGAPGQYSDGNGPDASQWILDLFGTD